MNIITEIHSAVAYAFKVGTNTDCFEFIYFSKLILTLKYIRLVMIKLIKVLLLFLK